MRLVGLVALVVGCAFGCGTDVCSACRSDGGDGASEGGDGASDGSDGASDGGDGGEPEVCLSGRAVLMCMFDGGGSTCLSDDGVNCRSDRFGPTECTNQCAANQSAFVCGWLPGEEPPGGGSDPVPPGVCTVVLHIAAGFTFYCCSSDP
jgi:hypothetical protein